MTRSETDEPLILAEFNYYYHIDEGLVYQKGDPLPPIPMPASEPGVEVSVGLPLEREFPSEEHRLVRKIGDKEFLIVNHVKVVLRFAPGRWSADDVHGEPEAIARKAVKRFLAIVRHRTGRHVLDPRRENFSYTVACVDTNGDVRSHPGKLSLFIESQDDHIDPTVWGLVANDIRDERSVPLHRQLMLDARLYRREGDFGMAVLSAAMALELFVNSVLQAYFATASSSDSLVVFRAKGLLKMTRAAQEFQLLIALVVGIPDDVIGKCRTCARNRNKILHEGHTAVSREEAKEAIEAVESLMHIPSVTVLIDDYSTAPSAGEEEEEG